MGLCHRQLRSTHDWSQSKNSLIYLTVPTVLLVVIFNAQIPLRILDILARMTQDTATNFTFYNLIVKYVDGTRASDIDLNISTDWEAVSTDLVIDHWTRIAAPYIFTNLIISLYQWKIFKNDDNLTFIWQEKPSTVVLDIWYNYYGWLTLRITFILHIYIYIYISFGRNISAMLCIISRAILRWYRINEKILQLYLYHDIGSKKPTIGADQGKKRRKF